MLIIDNLVAYSGGINIADEYINTKKKYGHWKDIGFKIIGNPVNSYTYMFIEFWNALSTKKINPNLLKQKLDKDYSKDGLILSYYDSPANRDSISNNLYVELLSASTNYVWFYAPYLI